MKNWLPFVLGPELAMESRPGFSCVISKVSSSNFAPYIDSPPLYSIAARLTLCCVRICVQADSMVSPAVLRKHACTDTEEAQHAIAAEASIRIKVHLCRTLSCDMYGFKTVRFTIAMHHTYVPFLLEKSPPCNMNPFMIL